MNTLGKRCFVHSDLGKGLIVAKRHGHEVSPRKIAESCFSFLADKFTGDEDLLSFPAFHYDYGKTRVYDVLQDEIQVGRFPEWVRKNKSLNRCNVPFFSALSNQEVRGVPGETINPFGVHSHFQTLYDEEGYIVLFGVDLSSMTFIHFIENLSGGPLYRYDKSFPGSIITAQGERQECDVKMHVRPMGVEFEYDWDKLTADLEAAGIMKHSELSDQLTWLPVKPLTDLFIDKISDDALYLLDSSTRKSFEHCLETGERVTLEMYEN